MDINPMHWWLILGAALFAAEAFGVSGVGMFFGGIAAFCVASLMAFGILPAEALWPQIAAFLILTAVLAWALWKPVQKVLNKDPDGYSNMVGDAAILVTRLVKGSTGQARWSGTLMNAELAADSPENELPENTGVMIAAVRGNTLIVKKSLSDYPPRPLVQPAIGADKVS